MTSDNTGLPAQLPRWIRHSLTVLLGIWMLGLSLFFFVRFSFVFYQDNAEAILRLLGK